MQDIFYRTPEIVYH